MFGTEEQKAIPKKYIDAGINENIYLKDISVDLDSESKYIELILHNGNCERKHRYYEPRIWEGETPDTLAKRQKWLVEIMQNFCQTLLGNEYELKEKPTFSDFIKQIITDLTPKYADLKKIPMRVKFVYDNKGFTALPKYGYIFERMDIEKSRIVITKWNKVVRDAKNNAVQPDKDNNEPFDDLPFK